MEITPWAAGATAIRTPSSAAAEATDAAAPNAAVEGAAVRSDDVNGSDGSGESRRQKPRRGRKPQINRDADEPGTRIVLTPGADDEIEVRDLVAAITEATGLDGEAIRDVLVLGRFSLATIPASGVDDAVEAINERASGPRGLRAEVLLPR